MSDPANSNWSTRPLLFVLLGVLGIVAYWAWSSRGTSSRVDDSDVWAEKIPTTQELPPWERPLPDGAFEPTPVTPEFDTQIELGREGPRNVVYFQITERHGFLADGVYVQFWHQHRDPDTGEWVRDSEPIEHLCRERLDFGGSLMDNTTLTDSEVATIPDLGASENWVAQVVAARRVAARAYTPMDDQAAPGPAEETKP